MAYELAAVGRYAQYDFLFANGAPVQQSLQAALDAWSPTLGVPALNGATVTYTADGVCLVLTATAVASDELSTDISDC